MLITCPECSKNISDKAIMCPNCGYPMKDVHQAPVRRTKAKRLPNGFGQISEIKGRKLRNPFRVIVTVGTGENGKPICKLLSPKGYFRTYNEAYQALMLYNTSDHTKDQNITFKELYYEWSEKYYRDLGSDSSVASHKTAWKYLSPLYSTKVTDARIKDIKDVVEGATRKINGHDREASANVKSNMKILLNLLYDYAMECDIVDKNIARSFNLSKNITKERSKVNKEHIPFTEAEKKLLWSHLGEDYVNIILIQCLTGFRPQELLELNTDDVDLEQNIIVGGMKTDSGRNRTVPIHSAIKSLVEEQYHLAKAKGYEKLFFKLEDGKPMSVFNYTARFKKVMKKYQLNPDHRPHDPRKDFVTEAKKYKMDEYALKRIVGHSIKDITERVYTERDTKWLQEEIEKIKLE